jgi:hypothetical protein
VAVRFDAVGDALQRSASLPADFTGFTLCGWAVLETDINGNAALASIDDTPFHASTNTFILLTDSDGTSLCVYDGALSSPIASLTVGTPFFWAAVGSGSGAGGFTLYYRTASQNTFTTLTRTGKSGAVGGITVGADSFYDFDYWPGLVSGVKCWDRALSAAELMVESFYERPMFPASLNFWWPLHHSGDTADRSGNGRDATVIGSVGTGESKVSLWRPRRRIHVPASAAPGASSILRQMMQLG